MRSIKEALLERWQAQADAVDLAKVDPDIEYDPTNNSFLFLGEAEVSSHAFVVFLTYLLTNIGYRSALVRNAL